MQRSLSQLTLALVLATCLLLQSAGVHCADGATNDRNQQKTSPMDAYLMLKALLAQESNRLPGTRFYDNVFDDIVSERSRRSGPAVDTFEPVPFRLLRRMMLNRMIEQEEENQLGRVEANNDFFKSIGRR